METPQEAARRLAAPIIRGGFEPEALHEYVNVDGEPIYYRFRLKHPDGRKEIRPMHLNGAGYTLGEPKFVGRRKPLYGLDRIGSCGAELPIYVVEGEKAADALLGLGAVATTSGNAQSAKQADWTPLHGRACILWPDNDDQGRAYAGDVAAILQELNCRLSAVDIEALALPPKGDGYDWVKAHPNATLNDLASLATIQAKPAERPHAHLRILSVAEIQAMKLPRSLVRNVIRCNTLVLLWGASGSGKTFFALDLGMAVARGCRWFGRRVQRGGVVYLAGEGHLKARLDAYLQAHNLTAEDVTGLRGLSTNLNLLDPDADILPLLRELETSATQMGAVDLVVLDTLNAMMPGGDENASEDMGRMIAVARQIMAALNCAVVYVHHCGKDEVRGARGHSSLRAAVDTELVVKDVGSHRTVTVEKQRDGESGQEIAFRLLPVDLGPSTDPDADPEEREGSCVVEPMDAAPQAPQRQPKRDVALDALHATISEHGQTMPGTSSLPPGVRAVRLDQWQARWRMQTGDDYGNDDSAAAAFRRERKKLLEAGSVRCAGKLAWLT